MSLPPLEGFLNWLLSGLGPTPLLTVFVVFVVVVGTAAFLAMLRYLCLGPILEPIYLVLLAPLVEELTCRIFLVGCVMTVLWACAAPQTTVLCGVMFGLMHVFTALELHDWLRVVDGLVMGFFNTIACLVYLRLFLPVSDVGLEGWLIAYGALVLVHAVYNFLTVFFKAFPLLRVALRVGGVLFAIAAWFAWMPRLT